MKAIIPVAGVGTQLRPLTYTQPKALIPLAGKTILSVIIDQLLEADVSEFVFVIGYLGEKIQNYIYLHYPNINAHFVHQIERKGTGHAIWLTKEIVGNEDVIIVLGDTICDYNLQALAQQNTCLLGVHKVDDPRGFGVAEINQEDTVIRVEEKPLIPKSNYALVGIYLIRETNLLFQCLEDILSKPLASNQEYPLTDAIDQMIQNHNVDFKAFKVNTWFDCGKKETLLKTNATLLKGVPSQDYAALFPDSVIIPPVSIAKNCNLKFAIIGPNVTIGEATVIEYAIIKNSIIGSYAKIEDVLMHGSIIGSDASVKGGSQSLNIGDNTEIDLS